jgi:hypothetical protein
MPRSLASLWVFIYLVMLTGLALGYLVAFVKAWLYL